MLPFPFVVFISQQYTVFLSSTHLYDFFSIAILTFIPIHTCAVFLMLWYLLLRFVFHRSTHMYGNPFITVLTCTGFLSDQLLAFIAWRYLLIRFSFHRSTHLYGYPFVAALTCTVFLSYRFSLSYSFHST